MTLDDPTFEESPPEPAAQWLSFVLQLIQRARWTPFALCCWSFWVQMTYRVPGHLLFIVLPWVSAVLAAWSLAWWLGVFLLRLPSAGPFHRALLQVWAGMCAVIVLFGMYGAALFINGRFDTSQPISHASVVKDIRGVDTELAYVLPLWMELQSWTGGGTIRLPLRWNESDRLWAGQPVVVRLRAGTLHIPWVMHLERDREQYARQILRSVPTSAWAWKDLVDYYIDYTRWSEAKAALLDYLKLYPNDYEFARGCAVSFILARRSADAIEIMEPFLSRRPSYELYNLLGFEYHKLGRNDRAIELLQTSIPLEPDRYDAYYHLGYVYSTTGQPEQAIAMFEQVLKQRPDFPEITAQLNRLRKLGK